MDIESRGHASNVYLFCKRWHKRLQDWNEITGTVFSKKQYGLWEKDWVDKRLDFDLAWCMAATHSTDDEIEIPPFESWTLISECTIQSDFNYFLIIPYQPRNLWRHLSLTSKAIWKLKTSCLSDQYLYYKIPQIKWRVKEKFRGIINTLSGFHILLVNLKILYTKYGLLGLRGW